MKKINKINTGYTIIETMISVSLFLVIVMSGIGALLSANLLYSKSQNMRSIMDNLSFIMEDMSRNLRTGYNYRCITAGTDLSNANVAIAKSGQNCWGIAFEYQYGNTTSNDDQWVYYIDNAGDNAGKIFRSTQGPYGASSFAQLTPNEVVLTSVSAFSVLGAEAPPGNSQQPFVIIKLVGTITFKNVVTSFSLQTSASQRLIDV